MLRREFVATIEGLLLIRRKTRLKDTVDELLKVKPIVGTVIGKEFLKRGNRFVPFLEGKKMIDLHCELIFSTFLLDRRDRLGMRRIARREDKVIDEIETFVLFVLAIENVDEEEKLFHGVEFLFLETLSQERGYK